MENKGRHEGMRGETAEGLSSSLRIGASSSSGAPSVSQQKSHKSSSLRLTTPLYNKLLKQAKLFLHVSRKIFKHKTTEDLGTRMQTLFDLIRGKTTDNKSLYNDKRQCNFKKYAKPLLKFGKGARSAQTKIIALSPHNNSKSRSNVDLQLTVLNLSGQMDLYCFVSKFEDLSNLFLQIHRISKNSFLVIEKIDEIDQILGRNKKELQKLISQFQPFTFTQQNLHFYPSDTQFFRRYINSVEVGIYDKQLNTFETAMTTYFFIKKSLLKNIANLQTNQPDLKYAQVFLFAYNIVCHIVQINGMSFSQQIQFYFPQIQQLFKQLNENHRKQAENQQRSDHLPQSLINAHVCWRCKSRGFISCSTCSQNEGKTVALCLECYSSYHQTMNSGQKKDKVSNQLAKWEHLEGSIDNLLERGSYQYMLPGLQLILKQESK